MGILADRREQRRRQALAERYLDNVLHDPSADELSWLMQASGASRELALIELAFSQKAIGLIVAERDALDDQTAADVSHAIDAIVAREALVRRGVIEEWHAHWAEYHDALEARGRAEPPLKRIARVLLRRCGTPEPQPEQLARAERLVTTFRHAANEALREAFGVASLPEDRPPSALLRGRTSRG